jgi:hypothetical protein
VSSKEKELTKKEEKEEEDKEEEMVPKSALSFLRNLPETCLDSQQPWPTSLLVVFRPKAS